MTKDDAKRFVYDDQARPLCMDITWTGVAEEYCGYLVVTYDSRVEIITWGGDPLIPQVH